MKRFIFSLLITLMTLTTYAQKDVTNCLGIPVDGTKAGKIDMATSGIDKSRSISIEDELSNNCVGAEEFIEEKIDGKIYHAAEQMPKFPGGETALMKHISDNINYAGESNIQGRVVVQFVVYKTGRIGHIKTIRSLDPVYDKMVVNIIKSLPQFIPGKINGQPVNVWYTLPLTFKIQEI